MKSKTDRGVAGLTILLSLIVTLFVIGLLVMIFSIMGGQLRDASFTASSGTVALEIVPASATGTHLTVWDYPDVVCTIVAVYNTTGAGVLVGAGNYTQSPTCNFINSTAEFTTFAVNYTYTYGAENTATEVMNSTIVGVSSVVDWYDIFIVIGAMVVLILLVVIIITAIRSSGLVAEGTA